MIDLCICPSINQTIYFCSCFYLNQFNRNNKRVTVNFTSDFESSTILDDAGLVSDDTNFNLFYIKSLLLLI